MRTVLGINIWRAMTAGLLALMCCASGAWAQQQPAPPQTVEWTDDFDGAAVDESKWERFNFEGGGGGGKLEVKDGQLRLRSRNKTRAGLRSKETFTGERFIVEARVAKVNPRLPEPGEGAGPLGFATLTILFDGSGRNRIEWAFTSENTFEAWAVVDGRSERIDNRKLGTKLKNPVIAIVRRGDEFLFIINAPDAPADAAQVGLTKTIKNLPRSFHVMLYGYGSSENNWDGVRVVTVK
ncbi:MAG: hypothetical protein ACRD9R_01140 [Pyrinomonadaceae bacterium]